LQITAAAQELPHSDSPRSDSPRSGSPLNDKVAGAWTFSVSGDSRNCGNVVMPAIATAVKNDGAVFYWHLGDYRAIYKFDEDYLAEPNIQRDGATIPGYLSSAWDDFIAHQLSAFAGMPVYLAAGNHETIWPRTHDDYLKTFAPYLDTDELRAQRLKDNPLAKTPSSYYHWVRGGVDFITLDNSAKDSYDEAQLNWFFSILLRDEADANIRSVVVGMHEALPDSLSANHSMCGSTDGILSGRAVYRALVHAQQVAHKNVYVLASHSHFYLENVYNTPWNDPKKGGTVLPGWIVGTAGAVRYKLPPDLPVGAVGREHVYGYLNGTVAANGTITFAFRELSEDNLKQAKSKDYTDDFIHQCVEKNPPVEEMKWKAGDACAANEP
jgi:hypothetical protein